MEHVDITVNKETLPEHFRMINIIYDPQKDQMQIQGHLTEWSLFDKMMTMARRKVEEHHNTIKK